MDRQDQGGAAAGVAVQVSRAGLRAEIEAAAAAVGVPVGQVGPGALGQGGPLVVDQRDVASLAARGAAAVGPVLVVGMAGEEAGIVAACRALGTPHGFELPAGGEWLAEALVDLYDPAGVADRSEPDDDPQADPRAGMPPAPLDDSGDDREPQKWANPLRPVPEPAWWAPAGERGAGVALAGGDRGQGESGHGLATCARPQLQVDAEQPVDHREPGLCVGVIPACGGAGASTLTLALAVAGAEEGDTLAVAADPWTCGLEVGLGLGPEGASGWSVIDPDAEQLDPQALRDGLPSHPGFWVLAGAATAPGDIPEALLGVMAAGRAGFDLTVVDFGRTCAGIAAADECDVVIIVLPATLAGVLGARRVWEQLRASAGAAGPRIVLACRNEGGLGPATIADYLGQGIALSFAHSRLLRERWDAGEAVHGRCRRKLAGWGRELLADLR